jgi:adenylate kinase
MTTTRLPQFLFLFGPPGSGKGTQAIELQKLFPIYTIVGVSQIIKDFIAKNLESTDISLLNSAKRMKLSVESGKTISKEDAEQSILAEFNRLAKLGTYCIIDGAYRSLDQAFWISEFLIAQKIENLLIHLHITLDESIKRNTSRWYVGTTMFQSFEEAKAHQTTDLLPIQRPDDTVEIITHRYSTQYDTLWAPILMHFQQIVQSSVFVIDASLPIKEVNNNIINALQITVT